MVFHYTFNIELSATSMGGKWINGDTFVDTETTLPRSFCIVQKDGVEWGHGIFISANKVLTVAFVLFESTKSQERVHSNRLTVILPRYDCALQFSSYKVELVVTPSEYKHPSYKFNVAVLIVSYKVEFMIVVF